MAKGGGSANKSYLFQETKALLNPTSLFRFLDEKLRTLGHRGLPALPPRHRHRRHVGRVDAGDGQAGLGPLPRHAADRRATPRPRLPRPRAGGGGAGAHPADRHRRPVRRQVLLPRRARDPPAPPRRLVPGRHRGVVLGRPPGARQDHRRGRVPRAARARSGAVPARDHRRAPRRRGGADRPEPADGRASAPSCRGTRSAPGSRSAARWSSPATSPTPRSRSASTRARGCRSTCSDHCVYYAGPAKTPAGYASGSFGPTTAGRMDAYVDLFRPPAAAW